MSLDKKNSINNILEEKRIFPPSKKFLELALTHFSLDIKKIFNESNNHLSIGILENGISVRFLGSSSQDARKCFFCIWKQIRAVCGFCEPKYQGVWPLQDSMNY